MYTKRAELTAGLVVLGGIAAVLALLYVATGRGFFRSFTHWHVRFAQGDVAPVEGDAVYYLGLEIGRVSKVMQASETRAGERLTPEDKKRLATLPSAGPQEVREIYVLAELELGQDQRLPRGTSARLKNNLVTGVPSLLLVPGFSREDLSPEETRANPILGVQGASLDDITGKVDVLIEQVITATSDVGAVVSEAKGFLQDLRKKVDALDTQAVSDEVLAAIASLRRSLASVEREIDTITLNVRVATDDLKTMAGTGRDAMAQVRADAAEMLASLKSAAAKVDEVVLAAAPKVDSFLTELDLLARQLKGLAQEFEGLGPEAKRVVTGLGHDLESIFANLQDASRNILDATEDLRAHPWKLANKPDGDEIAYENLRLSALTYMRAMSDMSKAAAELKLLASRPDAGTPEMRAKVAESLQVFDAALTRYKQAEERFSKLFQAAGPKAGR